MNRNLAVKSSVPQASRGLVATVEQFLRFAVVGGSGYAVNLAVFGLAEAVGLGDTVSACLAFLVAVANNFHWNRRWTFRRADAAPGAAGRFLTVSVMAFFLSLAVMEALVAHGMASGGAQLVAIAAVTPFSFAANRTWSFGAAALPDRGC